MSSRRLRVSLVALACLAPVGAAGCLVVSSDSPDGGVDSAIPTTTASSSGGAATGVQGSGTGTSIVVGGGADASVPTQGTSTASSTSSRASHPDSGAAPDATAGDDASLPTTPGQLNIDLTQTSVSGFSSGAFVAVQFHVAFSSTLKGAALFAGGPYDCAQGSSEAAETTCETGSPDAATYVALTKKFFAAGEIDDPSNLANEKVFIFGGASDSVVKPTVVDALDKYYASFMSSSAIQYDSRHAGASHTMPTLSYGSACNAVTSPFVGKCNYDGAGSALQQIYGTLNPAATTVSGKILSFSQSQFVTDPTSKGLSATGYYYVPASCANGEECKVHVSFHGCEQNAQLVQDAYYAHAGYNEWADTNHMVVLYPQAHSSTGNSYECWDFWGYDGSSYATKSGTQIAAVMQMVKWIAAGAGDAGK